MRATVMLRRNAYERTSEVLHMYVCLEYGAVGAGHRCKRFLTGLLKLFPESLPPSAAHAKGGLYCLHF